MERKRKGGRKINCSCLPICSTHSSPLSLLLFKEKNGTPDIVIQAWRVLSLMHSYPKSAWILLPQCPMLTSQGKYTPSLHCALSCYPQASPYGQAFHRMPKIEMHRCLLSAMGFIWDTEIWVTWLDHCSIRFSFCCKDMRSGIFPLQCL